MHQGQERERGISQPAIAVIPIPHATQALGKRGRGGGHDPAGRRVGQSLQCDQRTFDRVGPRSNVRTPIAPFAPKRFRALQRIERIDRRRRTLKRESVGEHEGNGLAGLDGELADCFEVFAIKFDRGAQDQTLRTGNRVDRAVIEPVDPWNGRSVVEAHHELSMKSHTPGPTDHDPDKIGAVGRRHEIDNRRTTGLSLKFGLEDERARTITSTYVENRIVRAQ